MPWNSKALRITAFPSETFHQTEPGWWLTLIGEAPTNRISKPREASQQEDGPFGNGRLSLVTSPMKIDWIYTSAVPAEGVPLPTDTLGPFNESCEFFLEFALRWLAISPPIQRLAFGALLLQDMADRPAGYQLLSGMLPFRVDAETSSDFFYQINRPRISTAFPDIRINRLTKWHVSSIRRAGFLTGTPAPRMFLGNEEAFFANLDLDVNTAAEFQGSLPETQKEPLFRELVALGTEIAERGDIP